LKLFVNYHERSRLKFTDNQYLKNFICLEDELNNVSVVTNDSSLTSAICDLAALAKIKLRSAPFISGFLLWVSRHSLIWPWQLRGVNLILSHWYFPIPITFRKIPIIFSSGFHPNSYEGHQRDEERNPEVNQLTRWYKRSIVVTYPAETWIKNFLKYRPVFKNKIFFAPHLFRHLKGLSNKFNDQKFHDPEKIKLIFVGRDGKRKGLYDLLEALKQLKREDKALYNRLQITVVTSTNSATYSDLNIIHYVEVSYNRVIQLMKDSHIFCLPTYKESYGHVFVEAMACGCAIICDDKNPRTEFFFEGEFAEMIRPGDVNQLKSSIVAYLRDPQLMRGHAKRSFGEYIKKYSYENALKIYEGIIEKIRSDK